MCSSTTGEALTIVRGETGMNGFTAWRNLHKRFNPTTPGKALDVIMEVTNPPKMLDQNRVPKAIDYWDIKVATLQRGFDEKLSDRMKTAVMLSTCPPDLQDVLHQHAGNLKTYEEATDRMKGMINDRIARNMPRPMDIGAVEQEAGYEDDVAAVSAYTQRHGGGKLGIYSEIAHR